MRSSTMPSGSPFSIKIWFGQWNQDGCCCENSAVGEKKKVNLPGVVDLLTLIDKDIEDILNWGIPNEIDMIALSFIRKGSDLVEVENQEGIDNFDEILANWDGFMVARGKPVITATQMLESMTKSPRPTRAEATDVANVVLDRTDYVILSGETAAGAYPEFAVQTLAQICAEAENFINYGDLFKRTIETAPMLKSSLESLAASAMHTAHCMKATLILVISKGGNTTKLVAKYRPSVPIISLVVPQINDVIGLSWFVNAPLRHSLIYRGLVPDLCPELASKEPIELVIKNAKGRALCKTGDSSWCCMDLTLTP
ncbi:hypothetical protein SO802_032032 [Lithocarpus litseifolius]|uniref:Pyruvate kinase n=1 Tax=Lithocarpus litseifolius TaxID=425828 RepID=A0AAW2BM91_9ROSI